MKSIVIGTGLVFLLAGCGGEDAGSARETDPAVERADHQWCRGDVEQAVATLESRVREDPDQFEAWYRLGVIRSTGEPARAADDLERARALRPDHPGPPFFIGLARLHLSDFPGAERAMRAGYVMARSRTGYALADTTPAARRGLAALETERFTAAAAALGEALETDPDNAVLVYLVGLAAVETGRAEAALETANRALKLDPGLTGARVLAARVLAARQQNDDARRELERALAERPDLASAHAEMARLHLIESEYRNASLEAWQALLLDPTLPQHHELFARTFLLMSLGDQGTLHMQHFDWVTAFVGRLQGRTGYVRPG